MNETVIPGGAAPALAAHSKDAATPGQTPTFGMTGNNDGSHSDEASSDTAKADIEATKSAVQDVAAIARDTIMDGASGAADHAAEFIRAQPLIALSVTGAICFAFGVLLGRR